MLRCCYRWVLGAEYLILQQGHLKRCSQQHSVWVLAPSQPTCARALPQTQASTFRGEQRCPHRQGQQQSQVFCPTKEQGIPGKVRKPSMSAALEDWVWTLLPTLVCLNMTTENLCPICTIRQVYYYFLVLHTRWRKLHDYPPSCCSSDSSSLCGMIGKGPASPPPPPMIVHLCCACECNERSDQQEHQGDTTMRVKRSPSTVSKDGRRISIDHYEKTGQNELKLPSLGKNEAGSATIRSWWCPAHQQSRLV